MYVFIVSCCDLSEYDEIKMINQSINLWVVFYIHEINFDMDHLLYNWFHSN